MSEEEKQYIINQADMYLSGMSYRQIAKEVGQSHVTVRTNIIERLRKINLEKYYKVLEKVEENKEKTVNDSEVRKRILTSYKLLTEENKTIIEIANILGTTEFTIYRDLTKRLKELNEIAPDIVQSEMVKRVERILKEHSHHGYFNLESLFDKELDNEHKSL